MEVIEPSVPAPVPPGLGAVRGLVYRAGDRRLVDGIDLDIQADKLTVIMGPNGAGKSLFLRLLHGLIEPSAGSVHWGGKPMDDQVRRQQSLVFQRPVLLRRSVAANLEFVLSLRGRVDPAAVRAILRHVGLEAQAGQPARLLSGGEQQRLALARALALKPRVLFLDEPTASLDPASTAAIERLVGEAKQRGTTVVFVTHDAGQARRLADEVVFLHRGRLLEQAPATRFFDRPKASEAADYLAGRLIY
jgi:tungstate transport system ATP-binding protein